MPATPLPIADEPPLPPPDETTILVVAEHALVRAGLSAVLGATPGLSVVAEAADLVAAAPLAERHRPDVVLVNTPPTTGREREAVAGLRRALPGACLLVLGHEDLGDDRAADALPCLPCDAGVTELCDAIGTLLGGRCAACAMRACCPRPRLAAALSRRERQVAVRVAAGLTTKQIAGALGVGVRTVNTYRESLARKVGASSAAVLTRYVLEHRLAER
jgi:DNA-binding NarL/FixJ family response regulator